MKKWFVLFSLLVAVAAQAGDAINYGPTESAKEKARIDKLKAAGPQVGMTLSEIVAVWGTPQRMNTTTTASGTTIQLVYADAYIYVDESRIVTTIQRRY